MNNGIHKNKVEIKILKNDIKEEGDNRSWSVLVIFQNVIKLWIHFGFYSERHTYLK